MIWAQFFDFLDRSTEWLASAWNWLQQPLQLTNTFNPDAPPVIMYILGTLFATGMTMKIIHLFNPLS